MNETMIGKTLSHYTILEEITRGELQIVYRARDDKLNRDVALKVLPPELFREPGRRQRFVEEAKAAAALEHPHIGVIHEIDEAEGVLFIVMELLRGQSLAALLQKGSVPLTEALQIATGIGQGLFYAHEHGIVHRDLKPANVMLTSDGYPKLVDFGLAKLLGTEKNPFLSDTRTDEPELRTAGTLCCMSPEQARGGKVDPRSDIFSFGLLLYHLLSGRPPFGGVSRLDTIYAILRDATPTLSVLSADQRQLLQPIVGRCLEKDPDQRYQTMAEVLDDLKAARRRLEWGAGSTRRGLIAAAMGLSAGAAGILAFFLISAPNHAPPTLAKKPSLAVLHFDNLSGDPQLDWLRTGFTEMIVTDLAQSPDIEVLGTDRLYQILDDLDGLEGPLPPSSVAELAGRASVDTVLRGSFAKAGESIRLSVRLEDAHTGKVLLSEKAEGVGQESVFQLVDELTAGIKASFSLPAPRGALDRDLKDVTTASVGAYKEYAEGIRLHERFREEEALPHFQRAVELDPDFAMALAKLGVVLSNLGRPEEADEYAEAALERLDRLSERERYYIEGWYYSRKPETVDRAIENYEKAIELYPDHASARHNLGNLLVQLESYDEAIEQLEELRARGMLFPATYENLAMAYKARGDTGRAYDVLEEYNVHHPGDWTTLVSMAQLLIESGDIDRGLEQLERAEALGATNFRLASARWEAEILEEKWDDALETALDLMDSETPLEKTFGGRLAGVTWLYRGQSRPVLEGVDRFVASVGPKLRTQPLLFKARLLLDTGDNRAARRTALEIETKEDHYGAEQNALLVAAIASARLGDEDRAKELARELHRRIERTAGPAGKRLYRFLEGELALADGKIDDAISHLNEAESMLPPMGVEGVHTLIWYALATAHRRAGNTGEAIHWYERILDATGERLFEPTRYVRSFYFLGTLREQEGAAESAAESYRRFLEHWEDGEIDRERILAASRALRGRED